MKYKIDEHTIEISYSGSGSIDPWSGAYAREIGLSQWGTSDIANFALIDGDDIYRLRGACIVKFNNLYEGGDLAWEEAVQWVKDHCESYFGSLKEIKADMDVRKKKQDEYDAMTPKEKEEYMKEWRRKRDERIAKIKEQSKNNK